MWAYFCLTVICSGRHRMTWSPAAIYPSPNPFPKEGGQRHHWSRSSSDDSAPRRSSRFGSGRHRMTWTLAAISLVAVVVGRLGSTSQSPPLTPPIRGRTRLSRPSSDDLVARRSSLALGLSSRRRVFALGGVGFYVEIPWLARESENAMWSVKWMDFMPIDWADRTFSMWSSMNRISWRGTSA